MIDTTVSSAANVTPPGRRPIAVVGFTIGEGRIAAIDVTADPAKLAALGV